MQDKKNSTTFVLTFFSIVKGSAILRSYKKNIQWFSLFGATVISLEMFFPDQALFFYSLFFPQNSTV